MKTLRTIKHAAPVMVLACAFAFICNGCSHEVSPVSRQQGLLYTITDWHSIGFGNPNNPYDSVGLQHNEALDYAVARRSEWSSDTLYPSCDTLIINFIDSVKGWPTDSLLWYSRFCVTHQDSLQTVWSQGKEFGSSSVAYITHLNSIIEAGYSISNTIDSIESLESDADTIFSGNARIVVLCSAAIARYSYSYWTSNDTLNWVGWQHDHQRSIVDKAGPQKNSHAPLGLFSGDWLGNDLRGAYMGYTGWDGGWGVPGAGQEIGIGVTLGSAALLSAFGS